MSNNINTNSGLGFTGALTILFIALKLLGKINWSWWWVLSPVWISALLCVSILLVVCIFGILIVLFEKNEN